MISVVLQVVAGIVIFLGAAIAVLSGYLFYETKVRRPQARLGAPTILIRADERIEETMKLIGSIGTRQAIVQSYGKVRSALVSVIGLEEEKDRTEREIMQGIKRSPPFKSSEDKLERIYGTYERVRFGSHMIINDEVELFLRDLRDVYTKLTEKTCKKGGGR